MDRLAQDGGACIVSTHLGKGFTRSGELDPHFAKTMSTVAKMDGWFAPASEILDWMAVQDGVPTLSTRRMRILESLHVLDRAGAMLLRR
jgi:hypothetical protein